MLHRKRKGMWCESTCGVNRGGNTPNLGTCECSVRSTQQRFKIGRGTSGTVQQVARFRQPFVSTIAPEGLPNISITTVGMPFNHYVYATILFVAYHG